MLWGENRGKWKSQQSPGVEPRTPLAWAASALPLSHNSRTTTNPHNPLCILPDVWLRHFSTICAAWGKMLSVLVWSIEIVYVLMSNSVSGRNFHDITTHFICLYTCWMLYHFNCMIMRWKQLWLFCINACRNWWKWCTTWKDETGKCAQVYLLNGSMVSTVTCDMSCSTHYQRR